MHAECNEGLSFMATQQVSFSAAAGPHRSMLAKGLLNRAVVAAFAACTIWMLAPAQVSAKVTIQVSPAAAGLDPDSPEMRELMDAAMEEAFEDMPFDMEDLGGEGGGIFGAATAPPITEKEVLRYSEILKFGEDQRVAALMVLSDRMKNFKERAKLVQDELEKSMKEVLAIVREGGNTGQPDKAQITKMEKVGADLEREQTLLETGVLDDLRALLTAEQQVLWPKVEQARRLDKALRSQFTMMYPGSRLNLRSEATRFVSSNKNALQASESLDASLEETLSSYEASLDADAAGLIKLEEEMKVIGRGKEGAIPDMEAMFKLMGDAGEYAMRLRQAHGRGSNEVSALLPEELRRPWRDAYLAAAYPKIFRTTHGERTIEAALKLSDLTEEQRAALTQAGDDFAKTLADARPRVVTELGEQQEKAVKEMRAGGGPMAMAAMSTVQGESRVKMKEADKAVLTKVRTTLTPEQRSKLPKRPRPNNPMLDMMRDSMPEPGAGAK